jgi:phosphoglycerol transferase MdoB-like AlkP superfamily enzyme
LFLRYTTADVSNKKKKNKKNNLPVDSDQNVKEIIVRRLGKFQKKHKTETGYDITTTPYKKNTLKNIVTNETAIY